jgi:hypothetical protein
MNERAIFENADGTQTEREIDGGGHTYTQTEIEANGDWWERRWQLVGITTDGDRLYREYPTRLFLGTQAERAAEHYRRTVKWLWSR